MTASIIYKGSNTFNRDKDPLELADDGVGRSHLQGPMNNKLAQNSIPQKRQLAQRQQRAIYGQQMLSSSQYQPRPPEKDLQQAAKSSLTTNAPEYKGRLPGLTSIKEKSSGSGKQ